MSADLRYFDDPARSWFDGGVIDGCWPRHRQPEELRGASVRLGETEAVATETLTGCCIAAHRSVWESVGLFDPGYFLIFEDTDWSLRASAAGVALLVVESSTVRHRVSRSIGSGPAARLSGFYFMRNGLRVQARLPAPGRLAFIWRFLVRPGPRLLRSGEGSMLLLRGLGVVGWLLGQRGPAPRPVQMLARRAAR